LSAEDPIYLSIMTRRSTTLHSLFSAEPEPIKALMRGVEVYAGLAGEDLREMAKFTEQTNVLGLPIHPIARAASGDAVREFFGPLADLPGGMIKHLRAALNEQPMLAVRGFLAGGSRRPFAVLALFPQSHAELAQGWRQLLWPGPDHDQPLETHLILLFLPDFERPLMLSIPESKLAVIVGTDDLRGAMLMSIELAHRYWTPQAMQESEAEAPLPEVFILPGGSFLVDSQSAAVNEMGPQTLVFSGESVPVGWEEQTPKAIPALAGRPSVEVTLAGAEPWVAQSGGWVCPLWFNPPLPAELLAEAPAWREAALHPAAVPFGVRVSEAGEVELRAGEEPGFVIVPRIVVPYPFAGSAAPAKVARVLRHSRAREAAMALWAVGFPAAEQMEGL
jgi:hypothetical protein